MAVSTIDPNGLNIGQIGGRRNLIINGDFSVAQRGTSFTTDNVYTIDRWYSGDGTGGSPARTLSQETFELGQTDVPGAYYHLRHNQTSPTTNGNAALVYKVEDVTRFDGQTVTFSFYAKADIAMDLDFRFTQDFGTGGSPSADVTITDSVTIGTTWQRYTITKTLGSLSGKTLGTDGVHTSFFRIVFDITPTTTFTFDLALCQLEYGDVATPFEHRSVGEEYLDCLRYYRQWGGAWNGNKKEGITNAMAYGTTDAYGVLVLPVPMRIIPAAVFVDYPRVYKVGSADRATLVAIGTNESSGHSVRIQMNRTSYFTAGSATWFQIDTAGEYFALDAEL